MHLLNTHQEICLELKGRNQPQLRSVIFKVETSLPETLLPRA